MSGIEHHVHGDVAIHGDIDLAHVAHLVVIGHVVSDNVVWVTDLWSPGRDAARTPGTVAVNEAVKKIGISNATFAGGHGTNAKQSVLDGIVAQN